MCSNENENVKKNSHQKCLNARVTTNSKSASLTSKSSTKPAAAAPGIITNENENENENENRHTTRATTVTATAKKSVTDTRQEQQQDQEYSMRRASQLERVNNATIEVLLEILVRGRGDRLVGRHAREPSVQRFLDQVPYLLDRIRAIHECASAGSVTQFAALVDARQALVCARDQLAATPLHRALIARNVHVAEYIVDTFIVPTMATMAKTTATATGTSTPTAMLQQHANWRGVAHHGHQLHGHAHVPSNKGWTQRVACELLHGRDAYGRTALHYAAAVSVHLFERLRSFGARGDVRDARNHTPTYYAQHSDQLRVRQVERTARAMDAAFGARIAKFRSYVQVAADNTAASARPPVDWAWLSDSSNEGSGDTYSHRHRQQQHNQHSCSCSCVQHSPVSLNGLVMSAHSTGDLTSNSLDHLINTDDVDDSHLERERAHANNTQQQQVPNVPTMNQWACQIHSAIERNDETTFEVTIEALKLSATATTTSVRAALRDVLFGDSARDWRFASGRLPVHAAAAHGRPHMCVRLIELCTSNDDSTVNEKEGESVLEARDAFGRTALHYAANYVVRSVDGARASGEQASNANGALLMRALVARGANAAARDAYGHTPAYYRRHAHNFSTSSIDSQHEGGSSMTMRAQMLRTSDASETNNKQQQEQLARRVGRALRNGSAARHSLEPLLIEGHGEALMRLARATPHAVWAPDARHFVLHVVPHVLEGTRRVHEAIVRDQLEMFTALTLDHPLLVRVRRQYARASMNALHFACLHDRRVHVHHLLTHYPELREMRDSRHATCLHVAARYGSLELYASLVAEFRCSTRVRDACGLTPRDYLTQRWHTRSGRSNRGDGNKKGARESEQQDDGAAPAADNRSARLLATSRDEQHVHLANQYMQLERQRANQLSVSATKLNSTRATTHCVATHSPIMKRTRQPTTSTSKCTFTIDRYAGSNSNSNSNRNRNRNRNRNSNSNSLCNKTKSTAMHCSERRVSDSDALHVQPSAASPTSSLALNVNYERRSFDADCSYDNNKHATTIVNLSNNLSSESESASANGTISLTDGHNEQLARVSNNTEPSVQAQEAQETEAELNEAITNHSEAPDSLDTNNHIVVSYTEQSNTQSLTQNAQNNTHHATNETRIERMLRECIDTDQVERLERLIIAARGRQVLQEYARMRSRAHDHGDQLTGSGAPAVVALGRMSARMRHLLEVRAAQHVRECEHLVASAIAGSHAHVQRVLQARPALALCRDEYGATPTHLACLLGHTRLLEWLVARYPAAMSAPDRELRLVCHYAALVRRCCAATPAALVTEGRPNTTRSDSEHEMNNNNDKCANDASSAENRSLNECQSPSAGADLIETGTAECVFQLVNQYTPNDLWHNKRDSHGHTASDYLLNLDHTVVRTYLSTLRNRYDSTSGSNDSCSVDTVHRVHAAIPATGDDDETTTLEWRQSRRLESASPSGSAVIDTSDLSAPLVSDTNLHKSGVQTQLPSRDCQSEIRFTTTSNNTVATTLTDSAFKSDQSNVDANHRNADSSRSLDSNSSSTQMPNQPITTDLLPKTIIDSTRDQSKEISSPSTSAICVVNVSQTDDAAAKTGTAAATITGVTTGSEIEEPQDGRYCHLSFIGAGHGQAQPLTPPATPATPSPTFVMSTNDENDDNDNNDNISTSYRLTTINTTTATPDETTGGQADNKARGGQGQGPGQRQLSNDDSSNAIHRDNNKGQANYTIVVDEHTFEQNMSENVNNRFEAPTAVNDEQQQHNSNSSSRSSPKPPKHHHHHHKDKDRKDHRKLQRATVTIGLPPTASKFYSSAGASSGSQVSLSQVGSQCGAANTDTVDTASGTALGVACDPMLIGDNGLARLSLASPVGPVRVGSMAPPGVVTTHSGSGSGRRRSSLSVGGIIVPSLVHDNETHTVIECYDVISRSTSPHAQQPQQHVPHHHHQHHSRCGHGSSSSSHKQHSTASKAQSNGTQSKSNKRKHGVSSAHNRRATGHTSARMGREQPSPASGDEDYNADACTDSGDSSDSQQQQQQHVTSERRRSTKSKNLTVTSSQNSQNSDDHSGSSSSSSDDSTSASGSDSDSDADNERVARVSAEFDAAVRREKNELQAIVDQIMDDIGQMHSNDSSHVPADDSSQHSSSRRSFAANYVVTSNNYQQQSVITKTIQHNFAKSMHKYSTSNTHNHNSQRVSDTANTYDGTQSTIASNQQQMKSAASSMSSLDGKAVTATTTTTQEMRRRTSCTCSTSSSHTSCSTCSSSSSLTNNSTGTTTGGPNNHCHIRRQDATAAYTIVTTTKSTNGQHKQRPPPAQHQQQQVHQARKNAFGQTALHFMASRAASRSVLHKLMSAAECAIGERDVYYRTMRDIASQFQLIENVRAIDQFIIGAFVEQQTQLIQQLALQGYTPLINVTDADGNDIMLILKMLKMNTMIELLRQLADFERWRDELHAYIRHGYRHGVEQLVARDRRLVLAKSTHARCALHLAVMFERTHCVETLVRLEPASVHVTDNLGRSALHYACALRTSPASRKIYDALLRAGADENLRDVKMRTPKYYGIFQQEIDDIRRLECQLS
ncbi:hypothetical protein GZH46_02184 [Fragariocoptes setiger]|uniref:Uncharacterized protein n=1 Tax=Fragariocoptes setiger TaxID=1670756 RepID=A0ABQ7S7C2_9ACAR|nr:hypothetical protein GZH46_02184 [Fragariocoptes setiger]